MVRREWSSGCRSLLFERREKRPGVFAPVRGNRVPHVGIGAEDHRLRTALVSEARARRDRLRRALAAEGGLVVIHCLVERGLAVRVGAVGGRVRGSIRGRHGAAVAVVNAAGEAVDRANLVASVAAERVRKIVSPAEACDEDSLVSMQKVLSAQVSSASKSATSGPSFFSFQPTPPLCCTPLGKMKIPLWPAWVAAALIPKLKDCLPVASVTVKAEDDRDRFVRRIAGRDVRSRTCASRYRP